jgi:hypothetical protein
MESWLSGRKQQFTKLPSLNGFQGFESLTLRIKNTRMGVFV